MEIDFEAKSRELEKVLRNIIAVGYQRGTPAARLNTMLNIAESAVAPTEMVELPLEQALAPF